MKLPVCLVLSSLLAPALVAASEPSLTPHLRTGLIWEDDRTGSEDRAAFTLSRAEFGGCWREGAWQATAVGEWVRSAAPGSLLGVAGNSYLLRPRQMEVGWEQRLGEDWLVSAAGGLLLLEPVRLAARDPLAELEGTPTQRFMGDDAADLGAEVRVRYGSMVEVGGGLYNGEGASDVERNQEQNLSGSIRLTPGGDEGYAGFTPRLEGYLSQGTLGAGSQAVMRSEGVLSVAHALGVVRFGFGVGEGGVTLADAASSWLRTTLETRPIIAGLSAVALYEAYAPDEGTAGERTRAGGGLRWQGNAGALSPTVMAWFESVSSDESVAPVLGASAATDGMRIRLSLTIRAAEPAVDDR